MTKQEMFNKVWQHFVVDKAPPSVNLRSNKCVYRGDNGERCAFGLFIPDNLYIPEMEGEGAAKVIGMCPQLSQEFGGLENLAGDLQHAHDSAARMHHDHFTTHINHKLRGVAMVYGLEIPK